MGKKGKTRTRSQIGKLSRAKGKVFERAVAAQYREIFGDQVKRGWQAREGHDAPDIEGVPGLWVEAKHHQRVNYRAALEQAEEAAGKAGVLPAATPVAHCKDNGQPTVVILREDSWFALVKELQALRVALAPDSQESLEGKIKWAAGAAVASQDVFYPAQPARAASVEN